MTTADPTPTPDVDPQPRHENIERLRAWVNERSSQPFIAVEPPTLIGIVNEMEALARERDNALARVEQAEATVDRLMQADPDGDAAMTQAGAWSAEQAHIEMLTAERDEALAARDAAEEHAAATRRDWDAHDTDCAELERQLDLARDERDAADAKVAAARELAESIPPGVPSRPLAAHILAALADPEADQ